MVHRDGHQVDVAVRPHRHNAADYFRGVQGLNNGRSAFGFVDLPNQVSPVEGCACCGPNMAQQHHRRAGTVGRRRVEHKVGEGQVGQEPPTAGQALQVGDPFLVEDAVPTGQFSQGGHAQPAYGSCGAPVPPGAGRPRG